MKKWAYYNDNEPYVCEWVRNLIRAGLIMDGEVDERDIRGVKPIDLQGFIQVHMFCGIAGWALALRRAAWPDNREVWTGSTPCQPFSAAGKQHGFADERHLWPYWHYLIAQRRPAKIFGEQVASAADWLRLMRGDLEALGYAVGTTPVEAASAGADHLRDRFWFVADQQSQRLNGKQNPSRKDGRDCVENGSANGVAQGDAHEPGPQGRELLSERSDERASRQAGVEYAASERRREGRAEHDVWSGRNTTAESGGPFDGLASGVEWVIGADGKARRVKSGICLLANGIPARVAKLRAFGNAIDPRPAVAFIKAALNLS